MSYYCHAPGECQDSIEEFLKERVILHINHLILTHIIARLTTTNSASKGSSCTGTPPHARGGLRVEDADLGANVDLDHVHARFDEHY